ncbi:unnamed protein product [marine sediment metagenome]|uniref:Uncharacterized protein n=1 Tax=marine sediment metagenome TaxID=412755 RepID=X1SYS9_9ZZZZ
MVHCLLAGVFKKIDVEKIGKEIEDENEDEDEDKEFYSFQIFTPDGSKVFFFNSF